MAEDEVEALVLERQLLGLGAHRLDLEPEPLGRRRQRRQHPGRDVGRRRALDRAQLEQVEREVAGARRRSRARRRTAGRASAPSALRELAAHLRLADVAEVDAPLGVVLGGRRVVVADVDVLDLRSARAAGGHRRAMACRRHVVRPMIAGVAQCQPCPSYLQQNQPPGVPPLALTGRAHPARRSRGELLVPAPPRRLRVDRRARAPACGSPTSPAARATAPTCSPARAAEVVGVDANPEAHEHARLRYRRAEPALRARPGRGVRRALRRGRLPADDRAHPRPRGAAATRFAAAAPRSPTSRRPTA